MGIAVLDNGKRKQTLLKAAELIFLSFSDRYLPFDCVKAAHYAQIIAFAKKGRPISVKDAQISAIAVQYSTLLTTQNTTDSNVVGHLSLVNPWLS